MTEIKLCKDCGWAVNLDPDGRIDLTRPSYWKCEHPSSELPAKPNWVTGTPREPMHKSCESARSSDRDLSGGELCGPEGRFWDKLEEVTEDGLSGVIGFGEALAELADDGVIGAGELAEAWRENAEGSIVEDPTEDDEGGWEWTPLWPKSTGLPFKIWLCECAPMVIIEREPNRFPGRTQLNQLYRWITINANALAAAHTGRIDCLELFQRLKRL